MAEITIVLSEKELRSMLTAVTKAKAEGSASAIYERENEEVVFHIYVMESKNLKDADAKGLRG